MWKKFFPHDSFVKLITNVVNVLNRSSKLNIWVEGSYGTGKSHAVITLKKLLEANLEETEAYFDEYATLNSDLKKKFILAKQNGKIIVVHRYGSSSINSDNDLILAIQESIESALKDEGINNVGIDALKTSVIRYLSDPENKASFEIYVKGSYADLFGCDVDAIINNLQDFEGIALQELMRKIFKVANEKQIRAFSLDPKGLCNWIHHVIEENNLSGLIFIWDEFTEYLINNRNRLTGFQEIIELSQTDKFCFIPVTHKSEGLLEESIRNKTMGRFIKPTNQIELPENTAFQLMGAALKKKEILEDEWNEIVEDLQFRTCDSRRKIKNKVGIKDNELRGILPIHPYSAYILKHISASFNSNQRSMFNFIKNRIEDSDIKTFQWFIDNVGPESENPFLSVDFLWSYFYESDRDALTPNIRLILDNYSRLAGTLDNTEKRILKAVLLLQALAVKTNYAVEILLPNEENINMVFEGSDLENGEAARCAEKLVRDRVLFKKKIGRDNEIFAVLNGEFDSSQIDEKKKLFLNKRTTDIIELEQFNDVLEIPNMLKLRYRIDNATAFNLDLKFNQIQSKAESDNRHIYAIATFAKNPSEATTISRKIIDLYNRNIDSNVIVIDCSRTLFSDNKFDEWVDNSAQAAYYQGKDKSMATTYQNYANKIISDWKTNIGKGRIVICDVENPNGATLANLDSLIEELRHICLKRYRLGLEHMNVTSSLWLSTSLKLGVECGVNEKTRNLYNSPSNNTKLEVALAGAWKNENYWIKNPSTLISQIKIEVKELIERTLNEDGRISIMRIYELLQASPFAFLPCNLTAFIMGFILKEYVNGKYSWSDSLNRDELSVSKMQEMIEEVIKNDITPIPRYRDKYIVTMSKEEKAFVDATSSAFHIPKSMCSTIEQARDNIRSKMKHLIFPIWTLDRILDSVNINTEEDFVSHVIKLYCDLANNINSVKSDNEIAIEIGRLCMEKPKLHSDLAILFSIDNCKKGMIEYLSVFAQGRLPELAEKIEDGGQYINVVRQKFDADAAAWVWKKETVDSKITEVILEYEVILASTPYIGKTKKLSETFEHWIEKCKRLRFPFAAVKNEVGELQQFLSMLLDLMNNGSLHTDKLQLFLSYIKKYGDSFIAFCDNQRKFFREIYAIELSDFSDIEVDEIFSKLPIGSFKLDKILYLNQLFSIIEDLKKQLGSQKLRQLWQDKTGTDSPKDWSERYSMPILCMLSESQLREYIKVFATVNRPTDMRSVEEAITKLENATFFNILADSNERNNAFRVHIIGQLVTILSNIEEVKTYLRKYISASPYDWMTSITIIKQKLNSLAEKKYSEGGYQKAFSKIDEMNADEVKSYLKDMIKNNMTVGIEIINS